MSVTKNAGLQYRRFVFFLVSDFVFLANLIRPTLRRFWHAKGGRPLK
ncbi:hypothetical protein [Salmonella enterica]